MRVLTTVLKPSSGTVLMDDLAYSEGNYEKIRRKIGYLPQELNLYPNLTVRECLEYLGELSGVPGRNAGRELTSIWKNKSGGASEEKDEAAVRRNEAPGGPDSGTLNEPEFLIVDEPTTGLDPEGADTYPELAGGFLQNRTVLFPPMWWRIWPSPAAGWLLVKKGNSCIRER